MIAVTLNNPRHIAAAADIPTGQAPIVYDSTNKKLAVWDGAAWVQTAALT